MHGRRLEELLQRALTGAGWTVQTDEVLDRQAATDMVASRHGGPTLRLQVTALPLSVVLGLQADERAVLPGGQTKAEWFLESAKDRRVAGMVSVLVVIPVRDDNEAEPACRAVEQLLREVKEGQEPLLVLADRSHPNGLSTSLREALAAARARRSRGF